jgi:hypothetical protein
MTLDRRRSAINVLREEKAAQHDCSAKPFYSYSLLYPCHLEDSAEVDLRSLDDHPTFSPIGEARVGFLFCELPTGGLLPLRVTWWAVGGRAGQLLPEHLFASSGLQLGKLAGEVLRPGRDARIAVNHASILAQNYGTEKRGPFSSLGLFQISWLCIPAPTGLEREPAGEAQTLGSENA